MQHSGSGDEVKIEEVDDVMMDHPVDEVPDDSSKNQPERNRAESGMGAELSPRQHQYDKGNRRNHRENPVVIVKHTPRRASVVPMDEPKETGQDVNFTVVRNRQKIDDGNLCELVGSAN